MVGVQAFETASAFVLMLMRVAFAIVKCENCSIPENSRIKISEAETCIQELLTLHIYL